MSEEVSKDEMQKIKLNLGGVLTLSTRLTCADDRLNILQNLKEFSKFVKFMTAFEIVMRNAFK